MKSLIISAAMGLLLMSCGGGGYKFAYSSSSSLMCFNTDEEIEVTADMTARGITKADGTCATEGAQFMCNGATLKQGSNLSKSFPEFVGKKGDLTMYGDNPGTPEFNEVIETQIKPECEANSGSFSPA